MWKNNSNGLVHANLSGAKTGDVLSIESCRYPFQVYEEVKSQGQSELNTREYRNDREPEVSAALDNDTKRLSL